MSGRVIGVGLGPGDPELMSVRADKLVRSTRHIAFFRKAGNAGRARQIVDGMLREDVCEHPMEYPVTTEISFDDPVYKSLLANFYEDWTGRIGEMARKGQDVVVLCEGDPFFYGSFMHLYSRLQTQMQVEVVPAITGMSAAWTASGVPITWGDDVLSTVMGTLEEEALVGAMQAADALVVMKVGRNLPKVKRALECAGKLDRAVLVEFASMEGQRIQPLTEHCGATLPYFSIILVHGQGRRP